MTPYAGLTFRKGRMEVNVHAVKDATVFYGHYTDDADWPDGLYRAPMADWNMMAKKAIAEGAEVFSLLTPNVRRYPESRRAARFIKSKGGAAR